MKRMVLLLLVLLGVFIFAKSELLKSRDEKTERQILKGDMEFQNHYIGEVYRLEQILKKKLDTSEMIKYKKEKEKWESHLKEEIKNSSEKYKKVIEYIEYKARYEYLKSKYKI